MAAVSALLLAGGIALDSQRPGPSTALGTSAAFSAKELAAPPRAGWLKNGGNLFNQNYSPLTQINRETVAGLKGVWRTHLNGSGVAAKYSGEAQPVVHDGVIYIVTGADDVFALGVKMGGILWTHRRRSPTPSPPSAADGPVAASPSATAGSTSASWMAGSWRSTSERASPPGPSRQNAGRTATRSRPRLATTTGW